MSKLSNYLVEQILLEDTTNPIKKTVVVYPGRFQPFHVGHYLTYQNLVKEFGKENVFIGTSNKVEKPKSPFNFKEKVHIMTTMFDIPKKQIVAIKNPYKPIEILSKFDEDTTAFVTVVGKKDANRLGGKYFDKYTDEPNTAYRDKGYVYVSPVANNISGTDVRNNLSIGSEDDKRKFFTKKAYTKFNPKIFDLVTDKLSESFVIQKETIENWLINESTRSAPGQDDDGPAGFFPNMDVFHRISINRAKKIGYEVINMIMSKDVEDYYEHPEYPNGPVKAVSFYPAGVIGQMTPNNQIDIFSSDAYTEWYKHVTRRASLAGYELITTQLEKEMQKKLKVISGRMAFADKEIEKEFELFVNEVITLPVEIGDTLLMGKFKNKKVVVKTIGKDEHGMPTINGKKVVTFRLGKRGPNIFERIVELNEPTNTDIITEAKNKLKLNIPSSVKKIDKAFKKHGKKVYIVGGAVRDAILGKTPHDFDLTTDAKPHEMIDICNTEGLKYNDKDIIYGLLIINGDEVVTFRKDIGGNRKLDGIDYTDIENDVKRRDLTINALFYDIDRKEIVDLVGGIKDLQDKKIKTVGKAKDRFEEDHLRKLRAVRFTVKLGGTMDTETLLAIKQDPTLKDVSANRIRMEFMKCVESAKSTKIYLEMMEKLKFLPLTFPGLKLNKSYIDESDYIVLMAQLLKKNSKGTLESVLNKINYTSNEITDVTFLISLDKFTPDQIVDYKKDQKRTKLSDKQILDYGKHNKKDYKKFVKFNTSVSGKDAPKDVKGKEIGTWIQDEEKRKFLNESTKDIVINNFKDLFKTMPSDLQKRVYNLKTQQQRLDKHPEGNVLKHTITVVNRSLKDDDIDIAIAAMLHDIGKDETAGIHPKKGHITHFGHEKVSASLILKYKKWIESIGGNSANIYYIVRNHMRYKELGNMRPSKQAKLKSFRAYDKLNKFSKHDRGGLGEMAKQELNAVEKFADKVLDPTDVEFTNHFFDRLNDPRNGKEITYSELVSFFNRLSKNKKELTDFLKKYKELVITDKKTKINMPLVSKSNQIIAKTVMRKDNWKTSNPIYKFESVNEKSFIPDVVKQPKIWYRLDTKDILKVGEDVVDLIQTAYKNTPLGSFVTAKGDLNKSQFWNAIDIDGEADADAVIFGRKTPNGIKIQGFGHDGEKKSKAEIIKRLLKILNKTGYWIEASDALEHVLYKAGAPYIKSEKIAQSIFPKSNLKMTENKGQYTRKLDNGKVIKETIFGKPKSSVNESIEDLYDDINEMLNSMLVETPNFDKNTKLITEGGTWGHMNHPFDTEVNLTFGQLKDIVNKALDGKLEFTREKTDGQALSVSWKNGKLIAARNKGHLKNHGENALDISGISSKFQGRGGLTDAYNFAMKDLTKAISSLSNKQKDKIFAEGSKFMQIEVIFPTSVNVIPYGQALLVFHGSFEYDLDANIIGESAAEGRMLAGMIKQINQNVQDNYTIQGPPVIELPKNEDLSKKKPIYKSKISKLQKEFGLKDSDGVADYHQAWWEQWINKNTPASLDDNELKGLVKRWAFFDKSFRLDKKNIKDEKTLEWAKKHENDNHKKISKDNLMKFEDIFLGVGADILQFTTSVLTVNPDKALRDMKKRLDQTIKDVRKSGDEKNIEKLKLELRRLNAIGGVDKLVPSEGIVFLYNGHTMKLSGTFASLNQLLGIFYA